ncbi:Hypothetical predicted protein [Olea europaea subsp. europaea]|uniref:Uncharacterized protein n=1 Tax=Olea europaea subsp. europaea TaxID=158383 RepID=A0A8S0UWM2_OLEEU|nr:Hypothetical predicted protein [Olea europaea subsp. europaea]
MEVEEEEEEEEEVESALTVVSMVIWLGLAIGTMVLVMEDVTPVVVLGIWRGTAPLLAEWVVVIVVPVFSFLPPLFNFKPNVPTVNLLFDLNLAHD